MSIMQTDEAKVVNSPNDIFVNLPLTKVTGKVRIKHRSYFADYGIPVAVRQTAITQSCYAEWQIGYDLLASAENKGKTSLANLSFTNYKGEHKYGYELSEVVFYAHQHGLLSDRSILECYNSIKETSEDNTFEEISSISRTNPKESVINGLKFYEMQVSYPLFVHRFGQYEIFAEIMIREKQRAVGTQAMLYVCLPIISLRFKTTAIGRTLESKECAEWHIGKEEALLSLEMFRVFGMLSPKHRHDVMSILKMLFPFALT